MLPRPVPDFNRAIHGLLGLPFDAVDLAGACDAVRASVARRTRLVLVTPNTNFVVAALENPAFRESMLRAGLSTLDGMVLLWLARLVGIPLPERVTGADLFVALQDGDRSLPPVKVFIFGGPDGVARLAQLKVNAKAQGVEVVGSLSPGYGPVDHLGRDEILAQINASGADFLVISLGAIKGHEWIEAVAGALTPSVISHLGAVVNYEAGTVRRAPRGFQVLGLEWLWRMTQEPALWRRYSRDGVRLVRLVATRLVPYRWFLMRHRDRLLGDGPAPTLRTHTEPGVRVVLQLEGAWTDSTSQGLRDGLRRAAQCGVPVSVDLAMTTYIDSAVVGLLMLLRGHLGTQGLGLTIHAASPTVRRILRYHCAEYLLDSATVAPFGDIAAARERTKAPLAG